MHVFFNTDAAAGSEQHRYQPNAAVAVCRSRWVRSESAFTARLAKFKHMCTSDTRMFVISQMRLLDLNSIDINPMRPWQFAVAGGEEWVRIYDQRRPTSSTSAARARGGAMSLAQPVCNSFCDASHPWWCYMSAGELFSSHGWGGIRTAHRYIL